jgi:hypothetical protein
MAAYPWMVRRVYDKSTILKLVCGLLAPSRGTVTIDAGAAPSTASCHRVLTHRRIRALPRHSSSRYWGGATDVEDETLLPRSRVGERLHACPQGDWQRSALLRRPSAAP